MPTKPNQNTAPAAAQAAESAANNGDFERLLSGPVSFGPRSMTEAESFSARVAKSQLVPKDYQGRPDNVFAAIQWGAEIGLSPMQALQGIAIINGRPSLWGDVMLALVMSHPAYEWHREGGDDKEQWFEIKRRGQEPYKTTFNMDDAKKAGLAGKQGPWTNYPRRMMQMRARGFALRDKFPDALKGMISREEAMDYQEAERPAAPGPIPGLKPLAPKTAQVFDATGTPVAADQITADQVDDLIAAITELATISGYEYAIALEKLSDWYASKRDGEVLPDLLDITATDYPAVLKRVQSWVKAVEKQNGRQQAETETAESESQPA